jgi:37-kD nucleoid-associated bacterial protein
MKFNTLKLSDVMVHKVPAKSDEGAEGPVLSEAASPRDSNVFQFFRQRMSGVMANRGLPIERDTATIEKDARVATVLDAVTTMLQDPSHLVTASQDIARRLYDEQDGRNPAGILVVALGDVDGLPCVGLLKLEHERGVQAEQEENERGQLVFRVILHDDLLLTEKTAVFKSAIFRPRSTHDHILVAEASDLQNQRDVAGFFLTRFLGCKLVDDPPEATRKYFDAAERYINAHVLDPEKQARYEGALLAQMNSAVAHVDPDRFARENLDAREHQPFLDHLKSAGAHTQSFPKDTARIATRIRRIAYRFDSGIKLAGTPTAMEEHVEIASSDAGTRVTVTDAITAMSGGG